MHRWYHKLLALIPPKPPRLDRRHERMMSRLEDRQRFGGGYTPAWDRHRDQPLWMRLLWWIYDTYWF